ncbi:MAG: hypothetical protein ACT4NV_19180 [Rhodoferax sp.]
MPVTDAPHPLPPGLVLWPSGDGPQNRVCVLISDIHCTDCTVGDQTADEADWQGFFDELSAMCQQPAGTRGAPPASEVDELLLVLNGDIVDLLRSSRWAEAGVYPWDREHPRFAQMAVEIMQRIAAIHGAPPGPGQGQRRGGFFYALRQAAAVLRARGIRVRIVPIVGNHDKELQVVRAARRIFYEDCLGLQAADLDARYRGWVAEQLGLPDEPYPPLPVYFADPGLRLLATHGQWRDRQNIGATQGWAPGRGWQPAVWQKEGYLPFSQPCFGDTVATGLLSYFIWATKAIVPGASHAEQRIRRILDEMDLYRPSIRAVLRLLDEAQALARRDPGAGHLRQRIIALFGDSLDAWLAHRSTWQSAPGMVRVGLHVLAWLRHLDVHAIDRTLMWLMARLQGQEKDVAAAVLERLPTFALAYRRLGLRLHAEGHTHVALQADLQFADPPTRRNYCYVNLGTWRDRIVPKRNQGLRRRGIGRVLTVFSLARAEAAGGADLYRFMVRDLTSWGDGKDRW